MNNIKLLISYDGSNYSGWQRQPNVVTIQEILESSIEIITKEKVNLIASGRTDSGVHALGQVANFTTNSKISPEIFSKAINSKLPNDIRVLSSESVDTNFNSRFSAKKKTYLYNIWNSEISNPFFDKYSMLVNKNLDFELMQKNAQMLIGTNDFTSFYTAESNNPKNPNKTIYDASFTKPYDKLITFSITGNGFLYNMVRIIVGTLIEIGLHKRSSNIIEILEEKNRFYAGATAKAKGLILNSVEY